MTGREEAPAFRERLLFWLLVSFMLGWFLLPSARPLYNRHHDWMVYGALVPTLLLSHWRALGAALRDSPILQAATALTVWLGLSVAWSRAPFEMEPWRAALEVLTAFSVPLAAFFALRGDRLETFARWLAGAAGGVTVLAQLMWLAGVRPWGERLARPFNFEHPNLFAHTLAASSVVAVWLAMRRARSRWDRAVWSAIALVCTAGVFMTLGRAAAAAALIGILLVIALAERPKMLIVVAATLVASAAVISLLAEDVVAEKVARGDAGRDVIWTDLVQRTADRPWIGNGLLADDGVVFPKGSGDFPRGLTMPHAHSVFVSTVFHGGVIGLGLLIAVAVLAVFGAWDAWRRTRDSLAMPLLVVGVVCLAVDGHRVVGNPHLSVYLLFWIPVALAARERMEARSLSPRPATRAGSLFLDRMPAPPVWFVVVFLVLVTAQRLLHFGPVIDDPHVWRQTDTANYARVMAEEGIDLLRPSVCWMGAHRTVVLEFPLPEAVMAAGYRVFGVDHRVARAVTLLFFAAAVCFLWLLVRELVNPAVARWSALVMAAMPLGLFYSRAIHIDPAALAFAHAMAWAWVVGVRRRSTSWMLLGAALAMPALLVKAPYAAICGIPVAAVVVLEKRFGFVVRRWFSLAIPVVVFVWWQWHTMRVNGAMPDWSFIPGYRRFDHNFRWYFGPPSMRLNLELWMTIAGRVITHVTGWFGLVPVTIGATLALGFRPLRAVGAWIAALGVYVLVFFNLNLHHDYYQLPFLAPLAVALVVGAGWAFRRLGLDRRWVRAAMVALLVAAAIEWTGRIESSAYTVPTAFNEMGGMIRDHTPEDALVVVSFGGLDCRSPHILYPAHRNGWSIPDRYLNPELLDRLVEEGATHLAAAWAGYPGDELMAHLPHDQLIHHGPVGARTVAIYRLGDGESRSLSGSATR
jgi:O-antigen ligase